MVLILSKNSWKEAYKFDYINDDKITDTKVSVVLFKYETNNCVVTSVAWDEKYFVQKSTKINKATK